MKPTDSTPRREIGVDIAKDHLDVFDGVSHWQVSNTKAGIRGLLKRLAKGGPPAAARLTCESTGRYGHLLAAMALEGGWPVAIANPRAVRDYARATGRLAKTDRIDAAVIAGFARAVDPPVLDTSWSGRRRFVELHGRLRALVVQAAAEKASLHQYHEPEILAEIRGLIVLLERRIAACEAKLQALVEESPAMKRRSEAMMAIKGVGKRTALALLASMPELGTLNRGEAAALAGLAPMNRDSGTLRGKRCIQAGRSPARGALYLAALSASRCHPTLSPFYKQLRLAGKSAKVAFCAVARKLLIQINSTLKTIPSQT
jgi:transposase